MYIFNKLCKIITPISTALSCSFIYVATIDYYHRKCMTQKWIPPIKYTYLLNPGLIIGALIGIKYAYLGGPLISSSANKIK